MRRFSLGILAVLLLSSTAEADLTFGIVAPFSGGSASLGNGMREGIKTYFAEVNEAGGVNGKQLSLVTYDDQYNPLLAAQHTRDLIDNDQVLAAIGNVGTPTAAVTLPIYSQQQTLLYGAFTGAGLLRQSPPDRYVINYRASYAQETAAMIEGLLAAGIRPEEIAFFTQNDSFGDAGYRGATRALAEHGFSATERLVHGRFTRGTLNIHQGLADILAASVTPRAIIMVGTYAPAAAFIEEALEDLPDALFLNVSFVGSQALVAQLGEKAEGVIVTQVVPPLNADLPGVDAYRQALAEHAPESTPDFISLEGYLAARLFVEGVKAAGTRPTRESVVDGLLGLGSIDLGVGEVLTLGPEDHQASRHVWPTVVHDGRFEPVDWTTVTP